MDEALRFFRTYEFWIYLLLGLGGIVFLRRFLIAWQELRGAIFGLERENAQNRLNQAASVLVLLTIMMIAEFVVVSFVAPMVPGSSPLPTATLDLLATATTTLEPGGTPGAVSEGGPTPTPLPTVSLVESGCDPDRIMITSPRPDDVVRGLVEIRGTATIPSFGFYKLEYARADEPLWLTIQAGRQPRQNDVLVEQWDTSLLIPGDYILQLVVVDTTGQSQTPCRIPVQVQVAE